MSVTIYGASDPNVLKLSLPKDQVFVDISTGIQYSQTRNPNGTNWVKQATNIFLSPSSLYGILWGNISGTLSNQTDLQSALDARVPKSTTITINGATQDLSANRTWIIPIYTPPLTTKGDLLGFDGTTSVRVPVGAYGLLTPDPSASTGLKWANNFALQANGGSPDWLFQTFYDSDNTKFSYINLDDSYAWIGSDKGAFAISTGRVTGDAYLYGQSSMKFYLFPSGAYTPNAVDPYLKADGSNYLNISENNDIASYFVRSNLTTGTGYVNVQIKGTTYKLWQTVSASGLSLTNGHIYVGSVSGNASDVAMSGDVTITNTGATTVGKLNGNTLSVTSGSNTFTVPNYSGTFAYGTGSTNQIAYWTGTNVALTGNNNFGFDGSNFYFGATLAQSVFYIVPSSATVSFSTSTFAGKGFRVGAYSLTDTSTTGTKTTMVGNSFDAVTFTTNASLTITNLYGIYFANPIITGGTATNLYTLGLGGRAYFGGSTVSTKPSVYIQSATSSGSPVLYLSSSVQGLDSNWSSNGSWIGVHFDVSYTGTAFEWRTSNGILLGSLAANTTTQGAINLFPSPNSLGGDGLRISASNGSSNPYIGLIDSTGNTLGSTISIGFGFNTGNINFPALITYTLASTTGNTNGDIGFLTRAVTTNTAPTERYRIYADGHVLWKTAVLTTANYGMLSIGSAPFDGTTSGFFAGNSNGTHIAINGVSTGADFINFGRTVSSSFKSFFSIDKNGKINVPLSGTTNTPYGNATLVAGTVTVSNTCVTANSIIYFTVITPGGVQGIISKGTIVAGTSFVINSSSVTDTSTISYWIIN